MHQFNYLAPLFDNHKSIAIDVALPLEVIEVVPQ